MWASEAGKGIAPKSNNTGSPSRYGLPPLCTPNEVIDCMVLDIGTEQECEGLDRAWGEREQ